jgi:serine/threonine protein kinase/tetratricopeptide (TPR) repeat protein
MKQDRFQKAETIFQAAVELPAADRDGLVADRCGDDVELRALVERLLLHHADGMSRFLEPAAECETARVEGAAGSPATIGPYKILESIGEGGMGVVYLAEQSAPLRRRVALKVIKLGMDTKEVVARFEAERQALALMDHPGIARVFDGGATPEGRPYFVMEHVPGIPITDYCDRRKLSMRERLELFTQVCEAVQHAHQKGIIHRDLKPSNILVGEVDGRPVPKVIDFGVAKAVARPLTEATVYTAQGQLIGTPEYMSPEQAEATGLDVDTRTDVYSLGVILYQLLAGSLPFDSTQLRKAGFAGILKILRETDPPRPSTRVSSLGGQTDEIAVKRRTDRRRLVSQLKGDLDWIVMRALEKDRDRRYGSPRELTQDIRRHLQHEPVLAGPPSAVYRTRKYVRRHRVALGFVALTFLGITTALVESNRQREKVEAALAVAEAERAQAVLEAEKAEQVSRFLQEVLGANDPFDLRYEVRTPEENEFAKRLLDQAAETVEVDLAAQPEVLAEVQDVIGRTYWGLELYDEARSHLEASLALRRELYGDLHPDVATSLEHLGFLAQSVGEFEQARSYYTESLEIRRVVLGERHSETATSLASLGALEWEFSPEAKLFPAPRNGSIDRAEQLTRASLEIRKETGDVLVRGIAGCNRVLALIHAVRGEYEAALTCARAALEARLMLVGRDHYLVSWDLEDLGTIYLDSGDPVSAEPFLRESRAIRNRLLAEDHYARLWSHKALAECLARQGRYAAADSLYTEALVGYRKRWPAGGTTLRTLPIALANARRARGDSAGAANFVRETLVWTRDAHGVESVEVASVLRVLADEYYPQGSEEAYLAHREELSIHQSQLGDDRRTIGSLVRVAVALSRIEARGPSRFATVDSLFREAQRMQQRVNDGDVPWSGQEWLHRSWGQAYLDQGRAGDAEPILREGVEIVRERAREDTPRRAWIESTYGACLVDLGRLDEAEPLLVRSYELLRSQDPPDPFTRPTLERLIDLYRTRGDEGRALDLEEELMALR